MQLYTLPATIPSVPPGDYLADANLSSRGYVCLVPAAAPTSARYWVLESAVVQYAREWEPVTQRQSGTRPTLTLIFSDKQWQRFSAAMSRCLEANPKLDIEEIVCRWADCQVARTNVCNQSPAVPAVSQN
jgi:hypothetical protein